MPDSPVEVEDGTCIQLAVSAWQQRLGYWLSIMKRLQDPAMLQDRKAKGKGKKGKHSKGQAQSPSPPESQAEEAANTTPPNDQSAPQGWYACHEALVLMTFGFAIA